jgi:hypothetical protein
MMGVTMTCASCGEWVEIPPNDELRFVTREEDATYVILAVKGSGTRLIHACGLRGARVDPR